jgi:hypothetical protein
LTEQGGVKVVIFGLAKSGTTALFYKIKDSLPPGTISLFEPTSFGARDILRARLRAARRGHWAPPVLAKVLPWDSRAVRIEDFDRFDRQVILVRDPRDRLVSHLLYRSYNAAFVREEAAVAAFLALLRQKEADPLSVPMMRLLRTFDRLERAAGSPASWRERYQDRGVLRPLRFHDERPNLPVFRYEQLVDEEFEPLETILGLSLGGVATVPRELKRVVRTKGYGAWRDWFTPDDVERLRPILEPYCERYYPNAEWCLNASPKLDPKYGSLYVESVINERRALSGLPLLSRTA